jgi:hypothetical protein
MPATSASAQPSLEVALVDIAMWLGPQDPLKLTLQVTNRGDAPAEGLRATVAIHEGIATRSHLERTFTGSFGPTVGSDTVAIEGSLAPGESKTVSVEKQLSEFQIFRTRPEDRAHPVRITVRPSSGSGGTVETHMIFFTQPVLVPLRLSLVIPLHSPATVYRPDLNMTRRVDSLDRSMREGPLDIILGSLEEAEDVPVTLAPSGLLLDLLQDLGDGYRITDVAGRPRTISADQESALLAVETLARISRQASSATRIVITTPYSGAFLPALPEARRQSQVGQTRSRLEALLGRPPTGRWVLPTPPVLDEPTLALLQNAGISKVILSSDAVTSPTRGARSPVLSRSIPLRIQTRADAAVEGVVADSGLSTRLADLRRGGLSARQRFLAETATLMLERPAQDRTVVALAPQDWSPEAGSLSGVLEALRSSPWMRGTTPESSLGQIAEREEVVVFRPDQVNERAEIPTDDYFQVLDSARRAITQFETVDPPNDLKGRLERGLLIAESAGWWGNRRREEQGKSFARAVVDRVDREFSKVKPQPDRTIALTSTGGVIPISITSAAKYPMRVILRLDSEKLKFPGSNDCPSPSSSARCIDATIEPRAQDIRVRTQTEATGTFPLRITVQAPDGTSIASSLMRIKSTGYNKVALWITAASAAFLAAWWIASAVRKRIR